jgi:hypothetical protein
MPSELPPARGGHHTWSHRGACPSSRCRPDVDMTVRSQCKVLHAPSSGHQGTAFRGLFLFVRPRRSLSAPKIAHTGCTAAHIIHSSRAERTRQHPRCAHRHAPRPQARRRPLPPLRRAADPFSTRRKVCTAGTGWPPFPDPANRNDPSAAAGTGGDLLA